MEGRSFLLEQRDLMQGAAGAACDTEQGRVDHRYRQACLSLQQLVEPAKERAASEERDPQAAEIRGQLGRGALQRVLHRLDDLREWSPQCALDLVGRERYTP